MGRILAIDFGLKRTGLAVTDPLKIVANSLETVPTEKLMSYLINYCQNEEVEQFVIGQPFRMNGEPSQVEANILEFIKVLEKKIPHIPIDREDERLTSKMAMQSMIVGGAKKKTRQVKGNLDKISATIILQSYLGHLS